jgi:hypothetical protein
MQFHKRAPHFRTRGTGADADPATKFHVKLTGSHFEPTEPWWDDGNTYWSDYVGSETVSVGPEMQKLIDTGVAKYVEIEDLQKRSLLNRLMDFAYSPNLLTFVLLASEQPYLLCLIGENVSVEKTWRDASNPNFKSCSIAEHGLADPLNCESSRNSWLSYCDKSLLLRKWPSDSTRVTPRKPRSPSYSQVFLST